MSFNLGNLPVPFIIADIGSNWKTSNNPSDNLIMAKRHIHDAAKAGVNAVKFQLYTDLELYGMPGPNQWSLPMEWLPDLAAYAAEQNVEFMCTAFSMEGYIYVDQFVNLHKVASSEMKHTGMHEVLVRLGKPFLVSTGGASQPEVEWLMTTLFQRHKEPRQDFAFLECVASYPAEPSDYNLSVLRTNVSASRKAIHHQDEEGIVIAPFMGVSDHTKTDVVALASVGLGALIFEKHFTAFDHAWGAPISTPDYPVSIGPIAMAQYTRGIAQAFKAIGSGRKVPRASEKDMTARYRRRLKVNQPIKVGEELVHGKNFGAYRSIAIDCEAAGPEMWEAFQHGKAKKDLSPGDPVWTTTVECQA